MIDVNWNDNAKAAVREFSLYIGQSDKCERYLEHVASKKTVADAVEWHKSKGRGVIWANEDKDCITYGQLGFAFADSKKLQLGRKLVCTRAEFEVYVKEQEGEKWTHVADGVTKCIVLSAHGETSWVLEEGDVYETYFSSCIKPIKPTISKEQHEFLCKFSADSNNLEVIAEVESYLAKHDIVEVTE